MSQGCDENFEINEVVWAKVLGYPWWPAQISQIMSEKNGMQQKFRVYFIADGTHADLKSEKLKKWDQKPIQQESRKLKDAIEMAAKVISGKCKNAVLTLQELNEHALKNFVIKMNELLKLQNPIQEIVEKLNEITNNELLAIIKSNLGQQLFQLHKIHQAEKHDEFIKLLQNFIDQITNIIGYQELSDLTSTKKKQKQSFSAEETLEEMTKCVIIQEGSDVKRKKLEDDARSTLQLNQQ